MNYEYIEQLIERYFSCQTTVQEEQILHSFFVGEDVPGHLMQYAELFKYEEEAKAEMLGTDFDEKILSLIDKKEIKLPKQQKRLAPFFRAAAIVAIVFTVGGAADHAISDKSGGREADNSIEINPYIRQADIQSTMRIKDVSQAEVKPQTDSLAVQPTEKNYQ